MVVTVRITPLALVEVDVLVMIEVTFFVTVLTSAAAEVTAPELPEFFFDLDAFEVVLTLGREAKALMIDVRTEPLFPKAVLAPADPPFPLLEVAIPWFP